MNLLAEVVIWCLLCTGSNCNQRWECSHIAISISTATCKL